MPDSYVILRRQVGGIMVCLASKSRLAVQGGQQRKRFRRAGVHQNSLNCLFNLARMKSLRLDAGLTDL